MHLQVLIGLKFNAAGRPLCNKPEQAKVNLFFLNKIKSFLVKTHKITASDDNLKGLKKPFFDAKISIYDDKVYEGEKK